ncbi:MAG TPA: hypothetical protein VEJ63_21145 [Planctomycetota bacterium]|nr:hypothetical protein [Planctomycetota bacterium]
MRSFGQIVAVALVLLMGSAMAESSSSSSSGGSMSSSSSGTRAGELERQAGRSSSDPNAGGRSIGAQAGHYFLSRWYDLIDIVDFSVGGGPGFLVNVRATKLAQAIGGYSDAYRVGFRGRSAGLWREKRKEIGVSLLYYQKVERECVTGWVESFRSESMDLDTAQVYANNNDRSFLGIGVTVHALVLVDVNIRPMQAADFALGWLTIDVLEDDTGKPRRNKDL